MVRSVWGSHQGQLSFASILGPTQARAQYWSKICCVLNYFLLSLDKTQSHPYFSRQTALQCLMLLTAITFVFALLASLQMKTYLTISHCEPWPDCNWLSTQITANPAQFGLSFGFCSHLDPSEKDPAPDTRALLQIHLPGCKLEVIWWDLEGHRQTSLNRPIPQPQAVLGWEQWLGSATAQPSPGAATGPATAGKTASGNEMGWRSCLVQQGPGPDWGQWLGLRSSAQSNGLSPSFPQPFPCPSPPITMQVPCFAHRVLSWGQASPAHKSPPGLVAKPWPEAGERRHQPWPHPHL